MKNSIQITKLPVEQWQDYRDLRLEALQNEPQAFQGSYEMEKARLPEYWQNRLQTAQDERYSIKLFAKLENKKPIGMVEVIFPTRPKTRHVAHIVYFYVSRQYRNQGVGKKLMNTLLEKLKAREGVLKAKLSVISSQKEAIELYGALGFKEIGKLSKELQFEGKFYDEIYFEKFLTE